MNPIKLNSTPLPGLWTLSMWNLFQLIQAGVPTHLVVCLMNFFSAFFLCSESISFTYLWCY